MDLKFPGTAALVVAMAGMGCAKHRFDQSWAKQRPLGSDVAAYRAPVDPAAPTSAPLELEEPTGVLTLRQALALALMKNPDLAAYSWAVRAKEASALQAGLFPNPEVELEVEEFGGSGELKRFDAAETTLQLSQLIELGGKRAKRKRVAELESDLAGWDYEARRLDVLTEVTRAYVEVLGASERLALSEELVRLSGQVREAVSERAKAGKVSPIEETKADIMCSASRIERDLAQRDVRIARDELAATWGGASARFEQLEGQLGDPSPVPSREQLERLIAQNPDVARWVVELEKRQATVALERAHRIPDLTVAGGIQRFEETNDHAFVLGLSLPLPIADRNQGAILEARYELHKAMQERRAMEVRVREALTESYETLATAHAALALLNDDLLPHAQSVFDAVNEGYRGGKFDYLDVLDAQRTLFEAKQQHVGILITYHKAVADLERLVGVRLESVGKSPDSM